jgi:rod shape determining protein RodA
MSASEAADKEASAPSNLRRLARPTPLHAIRDLNREVPAGSNSPIVVVNPGWLMLLAAILLTALGIYAISLTGGLEAGLNTYARKQLVFLGIGLVGCAVAAVPHYRLLNELMVPLAILSVGLLIMVLLPLPRTLVPVRNGATRWINLGVMDFQPSEVAKIVFVMSVAFLLQRRVSHRTFLGMLALFAFTAVPVGLIVVEPDLGSAALFVPALMAMLVAGGSKLKHLFFVAGMGVSFAAAAVALSLFFAAQPEPSFPLLREHQVRRLQAMVNTLTGDESGADTINYQGDKARTIVGAGGLTGLDERTSRATIHFNALPEDHNDMIFAVVCNRFGFLGGLLVVALQGALVISALWVAGVCRDPFGRITAVGIAAMLGTQATVNIGMTVGLLPITGMTLPFVSYGGSSLLTGYIMIGLIINIALRPPGHLQRNSFEFE